MKRLAHIFVALLVAFSGLLQTPAEAARHRLHAGIPAISAGSYPVAVTNAGATAMAAWDAATNCGPTAGTSFAAASTFTGATILNNTPNIDVTGGTVTASAIDFNGRNIFLYGSSVVSLTDVKFKCGTTGCTTGDIIKLGQDSGADQAGVSNVTIDRFTFDSAGRAATIQHEIYIDLASTLTMNHGCFIHGQMDYIQTNGAAILNMLADYMTAFCTSPDAIPPPNGDHCEAIHFLGSSATITSVMIDPNVGGPIIGGITADIYFDPPLGTTQTAVVDGLVALHPGNFLWTLQIGGPGAIDFTIRNSVLQRGLSGYISGAGASPPPNTVCHDGGNNRDYLTAAVINPCL